MEFILNALNCAGNCVTLIASIGATALRSIYYEYVFLVSRPKYFISLFVANNQLHHFSNIRQFRINSSSLTISPFPFSSLFFPTIFNMQFPCVTSSAAIYHCTQNYYFYIHKIFCVCHWYFIFATVFFHRWLYSWNIIFHNNKKTFHNNNQNNLIECFQFFSGIFPVFWRAPHFSAKTINCIRKRMVFSLENFMNLSAFHKLRLFYFLGDIYAHA